MSKPKRKRIAEPIVNCRREFGYNGDVLDGCRLELSPADFDRTFSEAGHRAISNFSSMISALAEHRAGESWELVTLARFEKTADGTRFVPTAEASPERVADVALAASIISKGMLCGVPPPWRDGPFIDVLWVDGEYVSFALHPMIREALDREGKPRYTMTTFE